MSLRLLTLVWERAPYKDGALLLLLALADFADDEGLCWPSVERLANKARMNERHARRLIRQFEADGMVETVQRGVQHRPNNYRIAVKTLRELPERTFCPDRTMAQPERTLEVPRPDTEAPRSVDPSIEPSTVDEKTLKSNGRNFVEWFLKLLADTGAEAIKTTATDLENWADVYEKLIRIDKRTGKEIAAVCRWARGNDFWCSNFLSPAKLRKKNRDGVLYFDVFNNRMKSDAHPTTQKSNSRGFSGSNVDAFAELDRQMAAKA